MKIILLYLILSLLVWGCADSPRYKYTIIDKSGETHIFYSPETTCSENIRFDTREPMAVICTGETTARFPYYAAFTIEEEEK